MSVALNRARTVVILATLMVLGLWSAHHGLTPVVLADATEVDIVGHIGGASLAVDVQGDYAYAGEGAQLTILDVSNPGAPVVAGKSPILPGVVESVAVEGNYAYVALGYEGLAILDVATPSAPTVVGTLGGSSVDSNALEIVVAGQHAYVAAEYDGLWIVDVTNPAAPAELSANEAGGGALSLEVAGNFAYVVSGGRLYVVDVTDPEAPVETGTYSHEGDERADVAVLGDYAYIVSDSEEFEVVDITDSAAPVGAGSMELSSGYPSAGVTVVGNQAYVIDYCGGLTTVDISDSADPAEAGYLAQREGDCLGPLGVVVAGDYAYFNDYYGLRIADISDPGNPAEVSSYDTVGVPYGLTTAGDYVYVADGYAGLIIIDAADPAHPSRVGSYDTPGEALEVVVSGDYAYLADYYGGLQIIDVADPTAPVAAGSMGSLGDVFSLDVAGDYAYVTADSGGTSLHVIDVSDPTNPVPVSSLPTPGYFSSVDVVGQYAYVANSNNLGGFIIVDVSNPADPVQVGTYSGVFRVFSMEVVDDYAYLAANDGGLRIVNVADPTAPVDAGSYDTPGAARDLAVSGTYAYVTDSTEGLRIIDVTDPTLPVEVGHNDLMPYARYVAVAGRYAYVTADTAGLYVLKYPGDDDDGQSDATEDGAPNNGDGNNDGIPDSEQANVVSLPNSENSSYVTLEAPAGIALVDVQAIPNPSPGDAPAGASFPVGFLDFEIEGIAPGEAVAVTIILHGGETVDAYYKYGPEPGDPADHWYEFDYNGTTGAELLGDRIVLHLVDGQRGDADLAADGVIVDPGAPALKPAAVATIYVSGKSSGAAGVLFGPHDILAWDGSAWSLWFDGSAAGLMPNGKAAHNLNAIWLPDPDSSEDVVMSFAQDSRFVPGVSGKIDGMDLVWWDGDSFSLWFDGQDVGLSNKSQEKIDALHVLDGAESPVGSGCLYYLLISTQGPGQVPGVGKFGGEDVLGFCMTNSGAATTGVWHLLLDGSAQGMPGNSTASISATPDGDTIYLTTRGAFNVDTAIGGHSMVYAYDVDSAEFSGPLFSAPANGFPRFVDALQY